LESLSLILNQSLPFCLISLLRPLTGAVLDSLDGAPLPVGSRLIHSMQTKCIEHWVSSGWVGWLKKKGQVLARLPASL